MATDKTTTQSPRKVKGVATYLGDDAFEFRPYNEGESTQKNVRSCTGGGKRFETTGQKEPKTIVRLQCPSDAADPYEELAEQFDKLTSDLREKRQTKHSDRQRVVKEECLEAWLNQAKGELTFTASIDLTQNRNWQGELLRLIQLLVRRLPADAKFNKVINTIKKNKVYGK